VAQNQVPFTPCSLFRMCRNGSNAVACFSQLSREVAQEFQARGIFGSTAFKASGAPLNSFSGRGLLLGKKMNFVLIRKNSM